MFNLSQKRKLYSSEWRDSNDVEDEFAQEHEYHKNLMRSGREEAIQNLGNHYTMRAFSENPDAPELSKLRNMMGGYYYYLKKYDKDFLKNLKDLVQKLIERFKKDPEALDKMLSQVPNQNQESAPVLGKQNRETKLSGHGLFLRRNNGSYRIKDTFVGRLLRGFQQYVGRDGKYKTISVPDGTRVKRTGPVAKTITKIQDEMKNDIQRTIRDALNQEGSNDADFLSSVITSSYAENGSLDLRPLSVYLGGPSLGFLLYAGVPNVPEHEKVLELKSSLGNVEEDFIDELKSSLSMENIGYEEKNVPDKSETLGETDDRHPTRDPHVLEPKRIPTSLDASSLVLTVASPHSSPKDKMRSVKRIIEVITSHPKAYAGRVVSQEDLSRISRLVGDDKVKRELERLSKFANLFEASDEDVLDSYRQSDDKDRRLIATLVARQGRKNIAELHPSMSLDAGPDSDLISLIDPADDEGLAVIKQHLQTVNDNSSKPSRILDCKIMESLHVNGDHELLEMALNSRGLAKGFAISLLLEKGGEEDKLRALSELKRYRKSFESISGVLMAATVLLKAPDSLGLVSHFDVSPEVMSKFVGREKALAYMKSAHCGWDGGKMPRASDIHSLTEDPLPLIRSYYELASNGDKNALASLHKIYHLLSKEDLDDFNKSHAFRFLKEAMDKLGQDSEMLAQLSPVSQERSACMLPDGSVMTNQNGVYRIGGTSICFSSSPKEAVRIAVLKLAQSKGLNPSGNN